MKNKMNLNVRQNENDFIPRLLEQYVEHPIENLPKIVRRCRRVFPHVKKLIFEIEEC